MESEWDVLDFTTLTFFGVDNVGDDISADGDGVGTFDNVLPSF